MTAIVRKEAAAVLAGLDGALSAVSKCLDVAQAKVFRDYAEAMLVASRQMEHGETIAIKAGELKLLASVEMGRLNSENPKATGVRMAGRTRLGGSKVEPPKPGIPTYRDLGVSKADMARCRDLAKDPKAVRAYLTEAKKTHEIPTVAGFRRKYVTPARRQERLGKIAAAGKLEGGPWSVFYADPAWEYEQGGRGAAENHYPTMPLAAICALPVREHTTPDAALFLWSTTPMIPDALRVIAAWGFDFKTGLVWVKPNAGTGQYVRGQHEHLFIATRCAMATPAEPHRPPSVVRAPAGKHSEKPAVFAEIIERMYPGQPRIELFARGPVRKGWAAWGNEVGRAA